MPVVELYLSKLATHPLLHLTTPNTCQTVNYHIRLTVRLSGANDCILRITLIFYSDGAVAKKSKDDSKVVIVFFPQDIDRGIIYLKASDEIQVNSWVKMINHYCSLPVVK